MYELQVSQFKNQCLSKLSNIKDNFDSKYKDIEIENAPMKDDMVDMVLDISSKIGRMLDELH